MSEFEKFGKKAQDYVEEHPEQADNALNKVGKFIKQKTGHQHDEQIDRAMKAAEQRLGHGRNQGNQGNQGNQQETQYGQDQQGDQN